MSVLGTVRELLAASSQNANRGGAEAVSKGAYWCDDCGVRIRDIDIEGETNVDGEAAPDCPECGEAMHFERSAASTGCAC